MNAGDLRREKEDDEKNFLGRFTFIVHFLIFNFPETEINWINKS